MQVADGGPLLPDAGSLAHRRFERWAEESPERTAIVSREGELTYGELDARANAIARRLLDAGVGREDIVGVCLPRRLDARVAI